MQQARGEGEQLCEDIPTGVLESESTLLRKEPGVQGGFDARGVETTVLSKRVKALREHGGRGEREQGCLRGPCVRAQAASHASHESTRSVADTMVYVRGMNTNRGTQGGGCG